MLNHSCVILIPGIAIYDYIRDDHSMKNHNLSHKQKRAISLSTESWSPRWVIACHMSLNILQTCELDVVS